MYVYILLAIFLPLYSAERVSHVREHKTSKLYCPYYYKIDMVDAKYGLGSRYITVTKKFIGLCNGKRHCSVSASNKIFGDPYHGKRKNLHVKYTCTKNGKTASRKATGKEHGYSAFLLCSGLKYGIKVSDALYGYWHSWTDGTTKVKKLCDGLKECRVPAVNYIFGDPAVGHVKKLHVKYSCVKQ